MRQRQEQIDRLCGAGLLEMRTSHGKADHTHWLRGDSTCPFGPLGPHLPFPFHCQRADHVWKMAARETDAARNGFLQLKVSEETSGPIVCDTFALNDYLQRHLIEICGN
jgi:hypothetical protein